MEAAKCITDHEFAQFQAMLAQIAGIHLSPSKKSLVSGRLAKRLQHFQVNSYGEYFKLLHSDKQKDELQIALDLLTTNETYFFREPKHFDLLRERIVPERRPGVMRIWSAACSTGEEPYSIAMVLADRIGETGWEILASDLSTRVLEKARSGHYAMERTANIPRDYLNRFCLKGVGSQEGTFLIDKQLRARVSFSQINLNAPLPGIGEFDVIFLRNVMIYFNLATKRDVVSRLLRVLKPGGYFIVGHSESLNGVTEEIKAVAPSVFLKPIK
ncbi:MULTISPECIES: protein-glutamate O-methyltransferase CheR [Oxalobacteraceae]|uniref:CheR family methyltransferase n=1 Tax=Oxalobacteraceae TaxID=75682 RepID=UPI002493DE89|nr:MULTISPECIES: protein-glutamate O-methyltransferase CheR [Oxalobacteraceae]